MLLAILLALAFVPMTCEAVLAARHEAALRATGAVEPRDDVFGVMQVTYPACFLAMAAEAWIRSAAIDHYFVVGLPLFAGAKALKYWAISTLGVRWTFRVLVPPDSSRIIAGPYRVMRHPNYVAVVGELAGMALMGHARVTGIVSIIGFGMLIAARIRVEERALSASGATEIAESTKGGSPQRQRR